MKEPDFVFAARRIVRDLRSHRPARYWADLTATAGLCWGALLAGAFACCSAAAMLATVVLTLALCRSAILLHQLTHLPERAVPGYRAAWNLLLGVPFLTPSFVYERLHRDHHRRDVYRTVSDPEHPPDGSTLSRRALMTLATMPLLPGVLVVRWLVLAPIGALHHGARAWIDANASSLCGNRSYRPVPLQGAALRFARRCEAAAFGWTLALVCGAAFSPSILRGAIVAWVALALTGAISSLRGELLHAFSARPPQVSIGRQVLDSLNVPYRGWLTRLLFPAGIGYHALHHLDEALPYHAMEQAHDRLMARLPPGSPYRDVTVGSTFEALLPREGRAAEAEEPVAYIGRFQGGLLGSAMHRWRKHLW